MGPTVVPPLNNVIDFCLLSVFNSHLFPSSSSIPRPSAYRHFSFSLQSIFHGRFGTWKEVMFFLSVMPSESFRFKFKVSWLCDDHTEAHTFAVFFFDNALGQPPLRAVEGPQFSKYDMLFVASRELNGDSRMETAIGPTCRMCHFPFSPRSGFLRGNGAFTLVSWLAL
jgi:hypothetical protein